MIRRLTRWHDSVFGKLVAVMVTMAISLLAVVSMFWVVVTEEVHPLLRPAVRNTAHIGLLVMLLVVIAAVVLVAHLVLSHLLRPLQSLNDGVARLGAGDLDVRLARTTRDEFGRLTDAFNEMAGSVRDRIAARDRLMMDVSHELRSPLTRMKVALELLPDDEQRSRLAEDVGEMERMVTELLELERLRVPGGVRPVRTSLTQILREAVGLGRGAHPGIVVTSDREVMADVDVERVQMVLRNLLDNAARHSLPDSRPIELSVAESVDTVVVRVTDDGEGIPPAEMERIFEPFYRVDRSRSKSTGGYGLGLSICKRVMDTHGGTISVEPAGRGTSFVLTFRRPASVTDQQDTR